MRSRPSQLGRNQGSLVLIDSLKTFLTFSGVTSKYFQISACLTPSSIIFSWFLQMSLRVNWSQQCSLFQATFQNEMAAIVLFLMSNSPLAQILSDIQIMAFSSVVLILRLRQTRMMMCFASVSGSVVRCSLKLLLRYLTMSFQAVREQLASLQMLNSSQQFCFSKQAARMEQQEMFFTEQQFLCFSFFPSSPSIFFSANRIRSSCRHLHSATSHTFWLSFSKKHPFAMIFFARLKLESNWLSLPMLDPPLSKHRWQRVEYRFACPPYPSNWITSFSQLMGWVSMQVHDPDGQQTVPLSDLRGHFWQAGQQFSISILTKCIIDLNQISFEKACLQKQKKHKQSLKRAELIIDPYISRSEKIDKMAWN